MHVETSRSHQVLKDGTERTYERHLLRRSWREARQGPQGDPGEPVAPAAGGHRRGPGRAGRKTLVDADGAVQVERALPHGHAAAVHAMARKLGFPAILGPPGPARDLAYALIISRVLRPGAKLSTLAWWQDVTLGPDLGRPGIHRRYLRRDGLAGRTAG